MVNDFNNYAKKNNLDVELTITLYCNTNSSLLVGDFGTEIEYLLQKHSDKYDFFFYDNMYSPRFSPYFIDISEYLDEKHMNLYNSSIAKDFCKYENKWVGLV